MKGKIVSAPHPRGGIITGIIVSIDRTSNYARAYGATASLDNGSTVCLAQCRIVDTHK